MRWREGSKWPCVGNQGSAHLWRSRELHWESRISTPVLVKGLHWESRVTAPALVKGLHCESIVNTPVLVQGLHWESKVNTPVLVMGLYWESKVNNPVLVKGLYWESKVNTPVLVKLCTGNPELALLCWSRVALALRGSAPQYESKRLHWDWESGVSTCLGPSGFSGSQGLAPLSRGSTGSLTPAGLYRLY